MVLNFDLITRVLEFVQEDFDLLTRCSRINTEFNLAAAKLLYKRVVVSPGPESGRILNLRDTGALPAGSNFTSALSPRNANHVLFLEISGYTSPRPPPRNTLPAKIASAIEAFINLRGVKFTPDTWHDQLFTDCLVMLRNSSFLDELEIGQSCTSEQRVPDLAKLRGLRKLAIVAPSRAILDVLPEWLDHLSGSLVELALKSNCGSVTPGVLRAILPHIVSNISVITLGLSYSLTNDDVFSFLGQLPNLQRLQLHYYWQLKQPSNQPNLRALRSFTVVHAPVGNKDEVFHLDKWIRQVVAHSPDLQELCLTTSHDELPENSASVAHNPLIDHICAKHTNIRNLIFRSAFISGPGLQQLLSSCHHLEVLSARARTDCLITLATLKHSVPHLHTASFHTCNGPHKYQVPIEAVEQVMSTEPLTLRRLAVDGTRWQALWKVVDNHARLIVTKDEARHS